jgi:hypothetical protein
LKYCVIKMGERPSRITMFKIRTIMEQDCSSSMNNGNVRTLPGFLHLHITIPCQSIISWVMPATTNTNRMNIATRAYEKKWQKVTNLVIRIFRQKNNNFFPD